MGEHQSSAEKEVAMERPGRILFPQCVNSVLGHENRKWDIHFAGTPEPQMGQHTASSAANPDNTGNHLGPQQKFVLMFLALEEQSHQRRKERCSSSAEWLGLFLFLRILTEGHDRRFNGVRENPATFFLYWTMQGIWVFVTLLPTLILNLEKHEKPLGFWDYLGWSMWALGFITEAVADQQKWHYRSNPDNAGRFIQTGLWAYSRHPNYLGEILLWTGLFLSAASVLRGWQFLSIISPLLVWFLLNYVSGIPLLEKAAMKRWGKEAAFQAYLQKTPVLWPVSWKQ
ncbi:uncharacterized protein LOC110074375 isoform X1 [Pogona vitticeps]